MSSEPQTRVPCFVVKLISFTEKDDAGAPAVELASVRARTLAEAIAIAMRRYPGCMAVHGERH